MSPPRAHKHPRDARCHRSTTKPRLTRANASLSLICKREREAKRASKLRAQLQQRWSSSSDPDRIRKRLLLIRMVEPGDPRSAVLVSQRGFVSSPLRPQSHVGKM